MPALLCFGEYMVGSQHARDLAVSYGSRTRAVLQLQCR
jgi:hypothetical protein